MYAVTHHLGLVRSAVVLLALVAVVVPCSAATFSGTVFLDGLQETPPVITPATGQADLTYDTDTNELIYMLSFSGLLAPSSAAHFHVAPPGVPGPVVLPIPITPGLTSEVLNSSGVLTDEQESDLLAGLWYINVHSDLFQPGEIRGQVNLALIPEPTTTALMALGLGVVLLRGKSRANRKK